MNFNKPFAISVMGVSDVGKSTKKNLLAAQFSIPFFSKAVSFLNGYSQTSSSSNLIQAQHDCFGAYTHQRIDDSFQKFHHTNWKTPNHD